MGKNQNTTSLTHISLIILLSLIEDSLSLTRTQVRMAGNKSIYQICNNDKSFNIQIPFFDKFDNQNYDKELKQLVDYIYCDSLSLSGDPTQGTAELYNRIAEIVDAYCEFHHTLNEYGLSLDYNYVFKLNQLNNLLETSNAYTGELFSLVGVQTGLTSMFWNSFSGMPSGYYLIPEIADGIETCAKDPSWKLMAPNPELYYKDIEKERAKLITLALATLPLEDVNLCITPNHNNNVTFDLLDTNGNTLFANMSCELKSIRSLKNYKNKLYKTILKRMDKQTPLLSTEYANNSMELDICRNIIATFRTQNSVDSLYNMTRSFVNLMSNMNAGKDSNLIRAVIANLAYLTGVRNKDFCMTGRPLPRRPINIIDAFNNNYETIDHNPKAFGSLVKSIQQTFNQNHQNNGMDY